MKLSSRKPTKTLHSLIKYILFSLDELQSCDSDKNFILGQKYALVDCLEFLQESVNSSKLKLDFDIEKIYPLDH